MPDDRPLHGPCRRSPGRRGAWRDLAWRAAHDAGAKNLVLLAGGVTYFAVVALWPALATVIALYGLVFDAGQAERHVRLLASVLPDPLHPLIDGQLPHFVRLARGPLRIGAAVAFLTALWTATRGTGNLMRALDIAYDRPPRDSFLRSRLLAVALTAALLIFWVIVMAIMFNLPHLLAGLYAVRFGLWLLFGAEWLVLTVLFLVVVAVLYRFGPNRAHPRWRFLSPGTVLATVLWVGGSVAFKVYIAHFGIYDGAFGALGAAMILLTWLWLSSFAVLLGAVLDATAEREHGAGAR